MRVGLIDVDGHNFPNIALMKLSAWHKANGDDVEWCDGLSRYDRVYLSKVFSFTPDWTQCLDAGEVIRGGTGYAIHGAGGEQYCPAEDTPLPREIEHKYPDYSIYGVKDTAYGFLTRGCPRGCPFCIVQKKEGAKSVKVAELGEFWDGQRNIVLCDPNLLACRDRGRLLEQLAKTRAWVDFNQGLDARMLDDDTCRQLSEVRTKEIHFAWDRYGDGGAVLRGLELYARHTDKPHGHNAIVYVLTNWDTTLDQDLERIYTLRSLGYWAYVMVYDRQNAKTVYRKLQRWVNNRAIFARCERFEDYRG